MSAFLATSIASFLVCSVIICCNTRNSKRTSKAISKRDDTQEIADTTTDGSRKSSRRSMSPRRQTLKNVRGSADESSKRNTSKSWSSRFGLSSLKRLRRKKSHPQKKFRGSKRENSTAQVAPNVSISQRMMNTPKVVAQKPTQSRTASLPMIERNLFTAGPPTIPRKKAQYVSELSLVEAESTEEIVLPNERGQTKQTPKSAMTPVNKLKGLAARKISRPAVTFELPKSSAAKFQRGTTESGTT